MLAVFAFPILGLLTLWLLSRWTTIAKLPVYVTVTLLVSFFIPISTVALVPFDLVDDETTLYPALDRVIATLGVPWLHVPGNHDVDAGARDDATSLTAYHHAYGPDTYAWEEREAVFVLHVFQKKSKRGIATPQADIEIIRQRLKVAAILAQELRDEEADH